MASTWQELKLLYGKLDEAERMAYDNARASPRFRAGERAVSLVRVLLERGELGAALLEGRRALEMTTDEPDLFALPARLAFGMAQALTHHRDASKNLQTVMEATVLSFEYRLSAALYLAYASHNDLRVIPSGVLRVLHTVPLGGLRLLSGPSALFAPLWQKLQGEEAPLQVRVLGNTEVIYPGKPLNLSLRLLEILVLLALNPNGLSVEQLHDRLYRDDPASTPRGLNVSVSRLRKLLPVSSQPLKPGVPIHFDVETC